MQVAETLMWLVQVWLFVGGAVSVVFLLVGIDRIDEDARGAYVFRPLLIPGILLLWPLVLWRWWQIEAEAAPWAARYRPIRASYGRAVVLMSIGIVVIVTAGLSVRQSMPSDIAPVQLSAGAEQ